MEQKLLLNPKTKDVVMEIRRQRESAKAQETEQEFYGNMFKTMKDSLERIGDTNTVKSQTDLMQKNTDTVFMLADGLSLLVKAMAEKDNTENLSELTAIKEAITKLAEKRIPAPIVNVEAPIIKAPEAVVIDKSTVIQETKEIQAAVKVLEKILEKVSIKQSSIVKIGNVDPDEAVAVRMVDKDGKNFVDLVSSWFVGGSGGGFPGVQTNLNTGGGTDNHGVVAIGLPSSSGYVVGGTATNPLNVTGSFTTSGSVEVTNDVGNPLPVNGTVAATQSGAWTVSISGIVDTELPTAAALNGTWAVSTVAPIIGAALMGSDGTNFVPVKQGVTTHTTAPTGYINTIPEARYNATPTARTEGQFAPLQQDANGNLLVNVSGGSTGVADNAAFTFNTTNTTPAGFVFDDTATNAVTENSAAAARISADRKQYTTGDYLDGATFTAAGANMQFHLIGAQADETSPTSLTEGQMGALRATLTRFLKISAGDYNAGEDLINDVQKVVIAPQTISTYSASKTQSNSFTTTNLKASAGYVVGFRCINTTASIRYLQLHNTATTPGGGATAQEKWQIPANSSITVGMGDLPPNGLYFATGIAYANSSVAGTYTAGSAGDLLLDINYN